MCKRDQKHYMFDADNWDYEEYPNRLSIGDIKNDDMIKSCGTFFFKDGSLFLTEGNSYKVINVGMISITIIDERSKHHSFTFDVLDKFFCVTK